jgi:hypothetical protein
MSNPWTDERAKQLNALTLLVRKASLLDNSNHFLSNAARVVDLAKSLLVFSAENKSFLQFLHDECINARLQERRTNEQTKRD